MIFDNTTLMTDIHNKHQIKKVLELSNLQIGYISKKDCVTVAGNINLEIKNGEMVCLLGPNGCGKSTLMRSLAGLQPILKGSVKVADIDIQNIVPKEKAKLLSLVLTDKLDNNCISVENIVAIGRHPYTNNMGKLSNTDMQIINHVLAVCGLEGFNLRTFVELSDGEKQRVMIARALAQDTPLMMLDEPTAHLDLPNRIEMMKTMKSLAKQNHKAILLSTHELDLALQWADTIWIMDSKGKIISGTPEDLVLNGEIKRVFENQSFYFDMMSGSFKMMHKTVSKLRLVGQGVYFEWTKRALLREGYEVLTSGKSNSSIEIVENNMWLIKCGEKQLLCSSIAELLECLRHEVFFVKTTKYKNMDNVLSQ